jgi:PAS domain S-box-containing protein
LTNELALLLKKIEHEEKARARAEILVEEKKLELCHVNEEVHKLSTNFFESDAKMCAIFEATKDGLTVVDENKMIKMSNPAIGKIFNYAPSELINKNILFLFPNDEETFSYEENTLYEVQGINKDKTLIPIELFIVEIQSGQQRYVYAMNDISERKEAEKRIETQHAAMQALTEFNFLEDVTPHILRLLYQHFGLDVSVDIGNQIRLFMKNHETQKKVLQLNKELSLMKKRAEYANQEKNLFLANMSHELRTPLNAIIGLSEMLLEDALDKNNVNVELLQRTNRSGKYLLELINTTLDLSKIKADMSEH